MAELIILVEMRAYQVPSRCIQKFSWNLSNHFIESIHISGKSPDPYTEDLKGYRKGLESSQAFFGHFEKNSRPKKLKDLEKLKGFFQKLKDFFQKLKFLPTPKF